ncbi:MAG: hypothetical protein AB7R55_22565, partial [Gemmatimonadales bacterium]
MPSAIVTQGLRKVYPAPKQRRRGPSMAQSPFGRPPMAPTGVSAGREILALDGHDQTVEESEFFGLLGPNGAGKSNTNGVLTTRVMP